MILAFILSQALAQDDDDLDENTVTGKTTETSTAPVEEPEVPAEVDPAEANRPYPPLSYKAAEVLRIDVAFADRCRNAIELIYRRDYKAAKKELDSLTTEYPTTGIGPSGVAVIYQALMFENYDFRYEKQYRVAQEGAIRQIQVGLQSPGNESIEYFLLAGMKGIEGIHLMRKGEFVSAIGNGLDAVKSLSESVKAAPSFIDPKLGDGMYMYWRTVVARASPLIPDGADERAAGKELMKNVEKEGVLLSPAATLALSYSYIEERDLRNALARTMYGRTKYPNNVINNMTAGRVLTSMRRYDDALRMYKDVLAYAPDNQRSHYHMGVVYARMSRFAEAEKAFQTYIGFKDVLPEYRGQAYYRLGLLYARQDKTTEAKSAYEAAVKASRHEAAGRALEKL
ncbi:MAG: tetratricopeptide repeat protein [Deltaproteobacteria bacterium]|nr:tetratricopeptide repeat protein [Deltaproteobacteria bacterium]